MTSEITLNDYLVPGTNSIKVLVLKWCDGSYLEDQDKIRLSGIFREAYLLHRDKVHITDYYVRQALNDSFTEATLDIEILTNGKCDVNYKLTSPEGMAVADKIVNARRDFRDKPLLPQKIKSIRVEA
jgi:beta-galactosidase